MIYPFMITRMNKCMDFYITQIVSTALICEAAKAIIKLLACTDQTKCALKFRVKEVI